jgi:hypothetical protein
MQFMAKRGRPSILGRPMSGAERMRRCRYLKGWADMMLKRIMKKHRKPAYQHNWNRVAPTDMLGNELAWACFDLSTHTANYERWDEIDRHVRKHLAELEREFPVSSLIR